MKRFIFSILAIMTCGVVANAQDGSKSLTVTITGVKPDGRNIMIGVGDYVNAPHDMCGGVVKADSTTVECVVAGLSDGVYKIYGFHDENQNYELDLQPNGVPAEGVTVDDKGSWEPKVEVKDGVEVVELKMLYIKK